LTLNRVPVHRTGSSSRVGARCRLEAELWEPLVSEPNWPTGSVRERVEAALEELRPALHADGGDVDLLRIEDDVVVVRLHGACNRCPMAPSTLTDFVAERVKLYAPEISDVVAE
jgi:Fe-S cluster biogenesis protein NfuA